MKIMAKINNNPKEKMRINIELADNGIIIRNPECEDDVTLAITSEARTIYNEKDLSNEYKAIGQKVYDWLLEVVIPEHDTELVITSFDIDVVATCKGRATQ